jgi:hypothetical protein
MAAGKLQPRAAPAAPAAAAAAEHAEARSADPGRAHTNHRHQHHHNHGNHGSSKVGSIASSESASVAHDDGHGAPARGRGGSTHRAPQPHADSLSDRGNPNGPAADGGSRAQSGGKDRRAAAEAASAAAAAPPASQHHDGEEAGSALPHGGPHHRPLGRYLHPHHPNHPDQQQQQQQQQHLEPVLELSHTIVQRDLKVRQMVFYRGAKTEAKTEWLRQSG